MSSQKSLKFGFLFKLLLIAATLPGCGGSSGGPILVPGPACGTTPYPSNTGYVTPSPITNSSQVWSFVSEPKLNPMKVTINTNLPGTSPGFMFAAPYAISANASYGQQGSLILDNSGTPFWFRPLSSSNLMNTDFRLQQFDGKPVLTFWQGSLSTPPAYTNFPAGSSEPGSCFYILDDTYRVIKTVTAQNGFISDVHEFLITPSDTALFLSTKAIAMDLSPYGGPTKGFVQDFAIQEVDLHTNQLLFFWDVLDHVPLSDSYEPASTATSTSNVWDVYHFNSIGLTDNPDDILVSSRNAWTIYRIHKPSGAIVWRLGGKQGSFTIEAGAEFSWQHDARFLPGNVVSMFDDNCCESSTVPPGTPYSHGLLLQLNLTNMTASLINEYYHDPNLNIDTQGNVQSLPNGNRFIGWGESQYYSEFSPGGNTSTDPRVNLLYDAEMPGSNISYRTYRETWQATPYSPPSIAAISGTGTTVYVSWNGATEVSAWQVFGGSTASALTLLTTAPKSGFETSISVPSSGPYFQVKALDAHGDVIGTSNVTAVNS